MRPLATTAAAQQLTTAGCPQIRVAGFPLFLCRQARPCCGGASNHAVVQHLCKACAAVLCVGSDGHTIVNVVSDALAKRAIGCVMHRVVTRWVDGTVVHMPEEGAEILSGNTFLPTASERPIQACSFLRPSQTQRADWRDNL